MKLLLFTFIVLSSLSGHAQKDPPGLIYACEKESGGNEPYDIFNVEGKKILPQSVFWAYSNTWSWIFVIDADTKLAAAYDYYGNPLGIDSIENSRTVGTGDKWMPIQRKGKWGVYDRLGKLRLPHVYDEVSGFDGDKAAVQLNGETFVIDISGKRVFGEAATGYTFDHIDIAIGMGGDFFHPTLKKINQNGKVGLKTIDGNKILVPAAYDELVGLRENFKVITAGINGKYGLVAFGGEVLIPLVYKSVMVLNDYF